MLPFHPNVQFRKVCVDSKEGTSQSLNQELPWFRLYLKMTDEVFGSKIIFKKFHHSPKFGEWLTS